MKMPFFSIVIPVYNRSEIFEQRLTYLLKQDFTDFEVVIVDDGSSDLLAEKLKSILTEFPNVRIIRQINSERGAARNNGIRNSNGEYVVLFDSDDFMHHDHLSKLREGITQNINPDFIATKFNFKDETGKIYDSEIMKFKSGEYDYRLFLNGNPLACNVTFKRNLKDLIYFNEDRNYSIKEDWMFMISNLKNHKLMLLEDVTISMFDHANRSMKSDNKIIIQRTLKATEWIKENIELSSSELDQLYSHRNYFCAIHSYLDNERMNAIQFSIKSILKGGLKQKYISILVKSVLGRRIILKVK